MTDNHTVAYSGFQNGWGHFMSHQCFHNGAIPCFPIYSMAKTDFFLAERGMADSLPKYASALELVQKYTYI